MSRSNGHRTGQSYETWGEPASPQANGGEDPQELNSTQTARERTGRAKARANTARGKESGKDIKAEASKEYNHPRADALSAVVSIGRQSARKTP